MATDARSAAGFEPVVTVSATYGAGGSVIAPRLAELLGWPFVDRLISADASQDVTRHERSQEGLVRGEQEATPTGRFLSYFARAATVGVVIGPDPGIEEDSDIRARAEEGLAEVVAGRPAVVLGRAAAVVLADRPRCLHVRLDGPVDRRIAWAAAHEGLDTDAASRRQQETDRARSAFVKRLYRTDPAGAGLYHLVVDPTAFGIDPTVELVLAAARVLFGGTGG